MKTVDSLIGDILRREGGFVNHPADRGGPTKHGITQRTLSEWLGRTASVEDVKTLEEDTAREIYERNYYRAPRLDTLPERIRPLVFDCSVNHGPRRAVMFVQNVVNEAGFGPVDVDGTLGPQTRRVTENADAEMGPFLVNALVDERKAFYASLIANDPSQAVFERGWMARAEEFRVEVV